MKEDYKCPVCKIKLEDEIALEAHAYIQHGVIVKDGGKESG